MRASRPAAIEVLNEVTHRLPDNSYLEKLSLQGDRMMLVGLIPFVGGFILLYFMCSAGTKGPNRFGPEPTADDGALPAWRGN